MLYLRQWLSFYCLSWNIQKKKTRYLNIKSLHVRKMLAFDIETTGLDPDHSLVTVVCTEDFETGERRAYEFARVRACEPQNEALLRDDLVRAFDEADSLCAFTGVRFDIPFLHSALGLSLETIAEWLLKMMMTTDILEAARPGLFGPAHTFGLNLLCQHNQVAVKRPASNQVRAGAALGRAKALLCRRLAHSLRPLPAKAAK